VRSIGSTISFVTPGGEQVRVGDTFGGSVATNYWLLQGRASAQPLLSVAGADTNINAALTSKGTGSVSLNTNGGAQQQLAVAHTASAVNFVQVTGAATGSGPLISAQGSDANAELRFQSKGTGSVNVLDGGGFNSLRVLQRATNGDTFLDVQRAVGFVDLIASSGVTNGDIRLTPKGTGLVRFGAYTAGALTATGHINIKAADGTTYKVLVST
jgi:hypothetical protein